MAHQPDHDDPLETDLRATSEEADVKAQGVASIAPEAGRFGRTVARAAEPFAVIVVIAAAVLLYEVFMRYALGAPTIWVHETSIFLCGLAFIYGGLYCASRDSHIRVVLIYDALPPGPRRIFDIVISIINMIAALFFAYASWLMVARSFWAPDGRFRMETSGSAWNPPYPAILKGFLLLVMIALAIQFLILARNYARRARG